MPSEIVLAADLMSNVDYETDSPSHARITLNRHTVRFIRDARAAWKAAESVMSDRERTNVRRLDLYFPFGLDAGRYEDGFDDLEPEAADAEFEVDDDFVFYPHLLVDGDDFFFRLLPKHGDDSLETDLMTWADFNALVAGLDAAAGGEGE